MKTGLSGNEVRMILKQGRRYVRDGVTVIFGNEEGRKDVRFAVVAGKRAAKNSAARSTVKRRLREAVRSLPFPPHPFVIICQNSDLSYQQLRKILQTILGEKE